MAPRISLSALLSLGLLALIPLPLQAQVRGDAAQRDRHVEIVAQVNEPTTLRMAGGARVPTGTRVEGNVAVMGGSLTLGGMVTGSLVVVNGDLVVEPGARVEGNVTVVGGALRGGTGMDWLGGTLHLDPAPLRYRIRGDRVELEPPVAPDLPPFLVAELGFGELRPSLHSAGAYSRAEGLPVEVGGLFESRSRNPLRMEALAIWRSASGLELERENLGYRVDLSQSMGGRGEARLALSFHDRILPIEERGMTGVESSLSTFLLRRDLRDHYRASGWEVRFETLPLDLPIRARLAYAEETHESVPVRDPWTLRSSERAWRPQPLVAEGALRTLALSVEVDTRDDPRDPSDGWWVDASLRRRVGGMPRLPVDLVPDHPVYDLATEGTLDLRRYNRLGPTSRLNVQLLASGSIDGTPLPPQFQRTLGGEGSLPGHPRFALDCGARVERITLGAEAPAAGIPTSVFPAYGCDGVLLARVEFQGGFPFRWNPSPDSPEWELGSLLALRPSWALFAGAGRGWTHADEEGSGVPGAGRDRRIDAGTRADVGAGLFVGPLGVYWALPLNARDQGINFFVRLTHRF